MTRRIAVIGCSFSDYYQDKNTAQPVTTWSEWMARDNPSVSIDNYACSGHGLSYVEFVLRYIIKHRSGYYDAVMFNIPPLSRSWMPIGVSDLITQDPDTWFSSTSITPAYNVMTLVTRRLFAAGSNLMAHGFADTSALHLDTVAKTIVHDSTGAMASNLLILDTIANYYEKAIPNLIYWSHQWHLLNNRSQEQTDILPCYPNFKGNLSSTPRKHVLEFLFDKYGEYYAAEHFITDSAHLSSDGNRVLYCEFLLSNTNVRSVLRC
jgi:hypothetical protein